MEVNLNWDPEKGYLKICPICERDFHGSRNKIYCCQKCKDHHTNGIARDLRLALKIDQDALKKNLKIIMNLYGKDHRGIISSTVDNLKSLGFDENFASATLRLPDYEGVWSKIGDYVYQIIADNKTVRILKYQKS